MTPNDKINALIPVFNWSWWQIFLLTLTVDWGLCHLLKLFDPPHRKNPHWWSALYGDLFLPIGIASSAVVLRRFSPASSWYTSRWWNWLVLVLGVVAIVIIEFGLVYHVKNQKNRDQLLSLGSLWHDIIFAPMFYLGVISLIPLFVTHTPFWAFLLALVGYGGWLLMVIHDNIWPPETKPASFVKWLRQMINSY